jgi:PilZ domain-containing protein
MVLSRQIMGFKRKQSRVEVGRIGRVQRGSLSAPCKVLDVSESGVQIESRMFVKVGDTLQLVIELDHGHALSCTIQSIHVRAPRFGARITAISPEDQERLSHILDDRVQRMFSSR